MNRSMRMGVVSALECLKNAGIELPDAIITGTGLGCVENTERFLNALLDDETQVLSPTPFMQSTHNTIGAQIAILLGCHKYNMTHIHRNLAFEAALIDSMMLINEGEAENVLVGGADEITQEYFDLKKRIHMWKTPPNGNLELLKHPSSGCIPGEGYAFFMVSRDHDSRDYARIRSVTTIHKANDNREVIDHILERLNDADLRPKDLDAIILGMNGNVNEDEIYHELAEGLFDGQSILYFKHLCGEYETSSAFALWTATHILRSQEIPLAMVFKGNHKNPIKNLLIYNQSDHKDHSFMLLSRI